MRVTSCGVMMGTTQEMQIEPIKIGVLINEAPIVNF